jgi:large subunit ribosomal protein L2
LIAPIKNSGGRNSQERWPCVIRVVVTSRDIVSLISKEQRKEFLRQWSQWIWSKSYCIYLLAYADGEKTYVIAQNGLKVGQKLVSGPESQPKLVIHCR